MSSTSSEENTEPSSPASGAIIELQAGLTHDSALEIIGMARVRLIEVEAMLRDLWYDTVDSGPALSARLNVAARLAHNAAEALSPETFI